MSESADAHCSRVYHLWRSPFLSPLVSSMEPQEIESELSDA